MPTLGFWGLLERSGLFHDSFCLFDSHCLLYKRIIGKAEIPIYVGVSGVLSVRQQVGATFVFKHSNMFCTVSYLLLGP